MVEIICLMHIASWRVAQMLTQLLGLGHHLLLLLTIARIDATCAYGWIGLLLLHVQLGWGYRWRRGRGGAWVGLRCLAIAQIGTRWRVAIVGIACRLISVWRGQIESIILKMKPLKQQKHSLESNKSSLLRCLDCRRSGLCWHRWWASRSRRPAMSESH